MKRFILVIFLVLVVAGGVAAWIFLGPATGFETKSENLYIRTGAAKKSRTGFTAQKQDHYQ